MVERPKNPEQHDSPERRSLDEAELARFFADFDAQVRRLRHGGPESTADDDLDWLGVFEEETPAAAGDVVTLEEAEAESWQDALGERIWLVGSGDAAPHEEGTPDPDEEPRCTAPDAAAAPEPVPDLSESEAALVATGLPGRLVLTAEVATLFAISVALEVHLTGTAGFHGVRPHPYWLLVLPIAATRGAWAGLVSAALATVLCAVGAYGALGTSSVWEILDLGILLEPALFFAVGFVIGELRDRSRERYRTLWDVFVAEREKTDRLQEERRLLIRANARIKSRVVDEGAQFSELIETATRIESADEAALLELALDLIVRHCRASACSVLAIEDGRPDDVLGQRGWPDDAIRERFEVASTGALVLRAIAEGIAVDGLADDAFEPGPLGVAPIRGDDGVLRALVCLDDVPPDQFDDSTVMTFLGITEWMSACFKRAKRGAAMRSYTPPRPWDHSLNAWIGSPEQLGLAVRVEDARTSRQPIATSLIALQALDIADITERGLAKLDRYFLENFSRELRPSDSLFRFGYPGCFVIVVVDATVGEASTIRSRIMKRAGAIRSDLMQKITAEVWTPDEGRPRLDDLLQPIAARFREAGSLALEQELPFDTDAQFRTGDAVDFARRLQLEWNLARRNGDTLYVIEMKDPEIEMVSGDSLARHLQQVSFRTLRAPDGVYLTGSYRCSIILTNCSSVNAFAIVDRLLAALSERLPHDLVERLEANVLALGESYDEYRALLDSLLDDDAEEAQHR